MKHPYAQLAVALVSGSVFGFGLSLSGMLNPQRVQGFLDVFGAWDPSLAFVLGGAVAVAALGVQIMRISSHPVFEPSLPCTDEDEDRCAAHPWVGHLRDRVGPWRIVPGPSAWHCCLWDWLSQRSSSSAWLSACRSTTV